MNLDVLAEQLASDPALEFDGFETVPGQIDPKLVQETDDLNRQYCLGKLGEELWEKVNVGALRDGDDYL